MQVRLQPGLILLDASVARHLAVAAESNASSFYPDVLSLENRPDGLRTPSRPFAAYVLVK